MSQMLIAILLAAVGSTGLFAFLQFLINRNDNKADLLERVEKLENKQSQATETITHLKDAEKVMIGNSIFKTASDYLDRGDYIYTTELKNLETMFEVYVELDGNSYAADIMNQIRQLRIVTKKK